MTRPTSSYCAFAAMIVGVVLLLVGCDSEHEGSGGDENEGASVPSTVTFAEPVPIGEIQRLDKHLGLAIPRDGRIEKLAEGFAWAEGPAWVGGFTGYLLFSDIPNNSIYQWAEGAEKEVPATVWMKPSGYTGAGVGGGEPGSNGLAIDAKGRLIICQHGDRRLVRLDDLSDPGGDLVVLADRYNGKRFNSPNDLCVASNGDIYFTDPPYGLPKGAKDPGKELGFQGVYLLRGGEPDGEVVLLTKELSRPNGIAFSPDERTLYVANSDPKRAIWMAYDVAADGLLGNGRVFFDATDLVGPENPGLPDGLKVDKAGRLFATGPGGVLIFEADGKHLGTLRTGVPTANCGWGNDGSVLYITADMYLLRVRTTTKGAGW